MRALRNLGIATAALLLALLVAAWLVPQHLDWDRTRGTLASFATRALGREVRIEGHVSLDLLPNPTLTANRISVADAGDGIAISAEALRLRVALSALLHGRIEPRDLVLQHPVMRMPFPFSPAVVADRPAWLRGLAAQVEDGRLEVGGLVVTGIVGNFVPDPVTGTLAAVAHGAVLGGAWQATARLGLPGYDGTTPLQLALDGEGPLSGTGGNFSGRIDANGAIEGQMTGRGPDLSRLLPAPRLAWQGEGRFSVTGGLATADALRLQIGDTPAEGAVTLRFRPAPQLNVALAAGRLDLDAWASRFQAGPPPPLLPGLATRLDLSAEAATLQGSLVRDLRLGLDLLPDHTTLREAAALLPGDARVSLQGTLTPGPVFAGHGRVQAADLRAALRVLHGVWPGAGETVLPDLMPHQAVLGFALHLDPSTVALDDIAGSFDGSAMQGSLRVQRGARPAATLHLALDHLVLDPLLARPPADPRLWPFDLDVQLQVRQAGFDGQMLDRLVLDGASDASSITLRSLEAGWQGLQGAAGFRLADGKVSDAKLLLVGPDAFPLRDLMPRALRGPETLWHGKLDAALNAAGPPAALAGTLRLTLGDARLSAEPVIDLPGRRATGSVMLQHPNAGRFLTVTGLPGLGPFLGDGSLSLIAQATVSADRLDLEQLDLGGGLLRAHGWLAVAFGAVPALSGQLNAATWPLMLPDPQSRVPMDFSGLRAWSADLGLSADEVVGASTTLLRHATTHLTLADGKLALTGLHGELEGGTLDGTASLAAETDPARFTTQVRLAGINIDDGTLSGDLSATAEGFSPAGFLATLGGAATLQMEGGVLKGVDATALKTALASPDPQAAVETSLSGGQTVLTHTTLQASASAGQVTLQGAFGSADASARVSGTIDVPGEAVDLTLGVRPAVADAPELVVRFSGPAAAPARNVALGTLADWLARSAVPASRQEASPLKPGP